MGVDVQKIKLPLGVRQHMGIDVQKIKLPLGVRQRMGVDVQIHVTLHLGTSWR
jgi:hypothetical protein